MMTPGMNSPSRRGGGGFRLFPMGVLAVIVSIGVAGCRLEDGDWGGPTERGLRAAFNGWDMWNTETVRPYEDPMPPRVEGTVPVSDEFSIEKGVADFKALPLHERKERAALTYRRYCHHCHGPNGDGRIIVGESHEMKPADLRAPRIQRKSTDELFRHLKEGGELMLPLAATVFCYHLS